MPSDFAVFMLREQRDFRTHRQQLRPDRDRLAVALGRRALTAAPGEPGALQVHGATTFQPAPGSNAVIFAPMAAEFLRVEPGRCRGCAC